MLLLVLAFATGRYFLDEGVREPAPFYAFMLLSLAGCLANGVVHFPFRVYSCAFLFMLLCGIVAAVGKKSHSGVR